MTSKKNPHWGTTLDEFLQAEDILSATKEEALRRRRHAADDARLDRIVFTVRPNAYAALLARLNAPPKPNDRLRRTMQTIPPWE